MEAWERANAKSNTHLQLFKTCLHTFHWNVTNIKITTITKLPSLMQISSGDVCISQTSLPLWCLTFLHLVCVCCHGDYTSILCVCSPYCLRIYTVMCLIFPAGWGRCRQDLSESQQEQVGVEGCTCSNWATQTSILNLSRKWNKYLQPTSVPVKQSWT